MLTGKKWLCKFDDKFKRWLERNDTRPLADPRRRWGQTTPSCSNFFHFHPVFRKNLTNEKLAPLPLAPPPPMSPVSWIRHWRSIFLFFEFTNRFFPSLGRKYIFCFQILFNTIDTDKDGSISLLEWTHALITFVFNSGPSCPFRLFYGPLVDEE